MVHRKSRVLQVSRVRLILPATFFLAKILEYSQSNLSVTCVPVRKYRGFRALLPDISEDPVRTKSLMKAPIRKPPIYCLLRGIALRRLEFTGDRIAQEKPFRKALL